MTLALVVFRCLFCMEKCSQDTAFVGAIGFFFWLFGGTKFDSAKLSCLELKVPSQMSDPSALGVAMEGQVWQPVSPTHTSI